MTDSREEAEYIVKQLSGAGGISVPQKIVIDKEETKP